jgi:hypothetical protein
VDSEEPPFAFAVLRGRVTLHDDVPTVREWAGKIAERYMGPERAEEFGERNGVHGELLVRMRVEHVAAMDDLTA